MMSRDPREDPQVGDVLRKFIDPIMLIVTEREVVNRCGEQVHYQSDRRKDSQVTDLKKWRKWAKGTDVLGE